MDNVRKMAAVLLMISGVTHVLQLFVYAREFNVVFAAVYGAMYFFIGLWIWRRSQTALWLGLILPAIGGTLGVYRFFFLHRNPFSVFHVIIDLIVVPSCAYLLMQARQRMA